MIAGLDYDSGGIFGVVLDRDGQWSGMFTADLASRPGGSFERARGVPQRFPAREAWRTSGITTLGVEIVLSRQRNQIAAAARVEGAILACLPPELEIVRLSVNRRTVGWKALTAGKTNASKADVQAWALRNGAPAGLAQDLYDAFAIARATYITKGSPHE